MKKRVNISNLIIVLFLTFCIQFTDFKIGLVKVSELLLLAMLPILFVKKVNIKIFYILIFFSIEAIISLVITYFLDFEYLGDSVIKRPYMITIGRYLELVSCLVLCVLSYRFFKSSKNREELDYKINVFVNLNIFIVSIFTIIYFMVVLNVISIDDTRLVYDKMRLRGYFVEGGPFGLMLSFIFILTGYGKKTLARSVKRVFLLIVIIFLAVSKAGLLFAFFWIALENFDFLKGKTKELIYPIIVIGCVGFYFLFINVSSMYVHEINKIKISLRERPNDSNLMMGRISAVFIVPKMIEQHPLLGIGTGNYPLLRNNDDLRGIFPLPTEEIRTLDAHGFGGLIDLLVDNGIIGLTAFLLLMYSIYRKKPKSEKIFLLGFLSLFLFGVQIYFLYPWILLGLVLVNKTKIYETCS